MNSAMTMAASSNAGLPAPSILPMPPAAAGSESLPATPAAASGSERPASSAAMDQALRLLGRREHGRAELQAKLLAKGHGAKAVAEALNSLQERGLQSDQRFAAALAQRRIQRGYGPAYLRAELRQRQVDDEVAEAAARRPGAFWLQRAKSALEKKYGPDGQRSAPQPAQARFLARRGFPSDIVARALEI